MEEIKKQEMESLFVPYEIALALKELGFDNSCFCYFVNGVFNSSMFPKDYEYLDTMPKHSEYILAPLYQQVFEFFRDKYGLIFCNDYGNKKHFYWIISKNEKIFFNNENEKNNVITYKTYEEAELECLKKLIEIIKSKL